MNNAHVARLEVIVTKFLGSFAIAFVSVLITLFINFRIITPMFIPLDECKPGYDIDSKGILFRLFYELDSGYHLDFTTFNIVFTFIAGIALGGFLSYRWIWKPD